MNRAAKIALVCIFVLLIVAAIVLVALLTRARTDAPTTRPTSAAVKFDRALVVTGAPQCSDIGRDILLVQNGSAVDAAIASMLCSGVVDSHLSGLGGGFVMTIYTRENRQGEVVDARETAPISVSSNMYAKRGNENLEGGIYVAVPGTVSGMWEAHRRHGRLAWRDLFTAASDLCRSGFPVTPHYARKLQSKYVNGRYNVTDNMRPLLINPATKDFYAAGEIMHRPAYARTLQNVATGGAASFYQGSMAKTIVEDIQKQGGVISMADMSRYREKVTQPLSTKLTLSDSVMDLISPPPPHSGAVVSMILNVLEGYGMTSADIISVNTSTLLHHRVVEAFKFAYAKRTHLGDPAFADVERHVHDMTSAAYVDDVRSQIRDDGVLPRADYHAAGVTSDNHGTSHISVLAPNGDAVAVTSTINYYWGAQVRSESLDIVFNNEMGDFATPDNSGATTPAPSANYIEAGKRPLSSMSPCILVGKDGDVEMVIGGAGGKRIPTAVAYVLLRNLWLGDDVVQAVDARLLHHQYEPDVVVYEEGFSQAVIAGLQRLGHEVEMSDPLSNVAVIRKEADGSFVGVADARRGGKTSGI